MNLSVGCVTDKGSYRKTNQDRIVCCSKRIKKEVLAVTCVCDGIGSFVHSETASEIVTNGIWKWFEGIQGFYPDVVGKEELIEDLEVTIRELNDIVCEHKEEMQQEIGCTMSLMFLINFQYWIFHVGDSRIYRVQNNLQQLTSEEVVMRFVNGREKKLLANFIGKSKALAIYRACGTAMEGDIYISGSDGLFKKLVYEDVACMKNRIRTDAQAEQMCRTLVQNVLDRGERDNVSCSVLQL